ncbi:MAG: G5 domain-containing protein [Candidatus Saccharibacteria bacterium]|nr:G5 domain-containing protein [Candidatus Saccharibacteria bacterium]
MRLPLDKRQLLLGLAGVLAIGSVFGALARFSTRARATDETSEQISSVEQAEHFVTFYVDGRKLTVKTAAVTVGEALSRANITLNEGDKTDPGVSEQITSDFNINVYRAQPVMIIDGATHSFIMTAAGDAKSVAADAGLIVYDGDEIVPIRNANFREIGDATVYQITRNGGRLLTLETDIPYETKNVRDSAVAEGKEVVKEAGEVGRMKQVYQVNFVNGVEAERILVSEEVIKEPVARVVATGTLQSIRPEWSQCAEWVKQAGVSDADLEAALTLIYHESGCRVTATNASSGAYGIPQSLPGNKMASMGADWETNPVTQIKWMAQYVTKRYGGWQEALDFWWCTGECRGVKNKGGHWY